MAKNKKTPSHRKSQDEPPMAASTAPTTTNRHKNKKQLRVGDDVHNQLVALADQSDGLISKVARRILIDGLKARGLWPPPPASKP